MARKLSPVHGSQRVVHGQRRIDSAREYDPDQLMKVSLAERLAAVEAAPPRPPRPAPRAEAGSGAEHEKRRRNWKRICEPRMAAALQAIELLQPLADKSRYWFTDSDWDKARTALMDKLAETDDVFKRGRGRIGAFRFDNGDTAHDADEPTVEGESDE